MLETSRRDRAEIRADDRRRLVATLERGTPEDVEAPARGRLVVAGLVLGALVAAGAAALGVLGVPGVPGVPG